MNKAYKFRLYPNNEQELLLIKTFGCCRFIYNKMLGDKIDYYKDNKSMLKNTPAQYKQEFEWLKEVDSYALCNEQMHLQSAFNNFFRKQNIGFPKFKSKRDINNLIKNYLKNFIPIGVYCHSSILGDWCPFYKSTWGKTINNYKRNRNECEWKNVCEDNCEECDETVSYCQFCNIIEYGDFPLGMVVKFVMSANVEF